MTPSKYPIRIRQTEISHWNQMLVKLREQTLKGLWGGGRVSWDKVTEWHGHIYTTKCKIDS